MAADPYPRNLRESLEGSKRDGLRFDQAWRVALNRHGDRSGRNHDPHAWPMEFMRDTFGRAYVGAAFSRDMTLLVEPGDYRDAPVRAVLPAFDGACHWGGGCDVAAEGETRFCTEHRERLHAINVKAQDKHAYTIRGTRTDAYEDDADPLDRDAIYGAA